MRLPVCSVLLLLSVSGRLLTAGEPKEAVGKPPVPVKAVELPAGRAFTLKQRMADQKHLEVPLPIRCDPPEAYSGLSLQTFSVALNGQWLDRATVQFRRDDKATPALFVMTVDLDKAAEAGTYTVKVEAAPGGQPAPALVEITLTRPPAELRVVAPLQVERTIYLPCVWSSVAPKSFLLDEKGDKSILVPTEAKWDCALRRPDGGPGGRLTLTLPTIEAGKQGTVGLEVAEPPLLGKATGTLSIRSPQLATGLFEATVEVIATAAEKPGHAPPPRRRRAPPPFPPRRRFRPRAGAANRSRAGADPGCAPPLLTAAADSGRAPPGAVPIPRSAATAPGAAARRRRAPPPPPPPRPAAAARRCRPRPRAAAALGRAPR
jgi:hypothetical protein